MKTSEKLPRRDFIQLAAAGTAGLAALWFFGSCEGCVESIVEAIKNRPVRRYIRTGSALLDQDMQIYADAVSQMKALPASDPRSWISQSNIHLNHCQHSTWFFFPWHRAYLFYFEQICRKLTGETKWGLPYWNWSSHPSIPTQFCDNPATNPLYHAPRSSDCTVSAANGIVGGGNLEDILNQTSFLTFAGTAGAAGQMESSPHNYVHGFVGGTMGTYNSPQDPIFWTHHNMVDCCWADWNINRNNDNTNDPAWANHQFSGMFVDGDGNPVNVNAGLTVLYPLLSYQFEPGQKGGSTPQDFLASKSARELKVIQKRLQEGVDVKLDFRKQFSVARGAEVVLGQTVTREFAMERGDMDKVVGGDGEERVLLSVGNIELPSTNDFFVRVFLNKPDATSDTPFEDIHFAGSFAFFHDPSAAGHHHGAHKQSYFVDLTPAIRRLKQSGELKEGEALSVQLVPSPIEGRQPENARFSIENLEIAFSPIDVREKKQE
jgi:tyrosinase